LPFSKSTPDLTPLLDLWKTKLHHYRNSAFIAVKPDDADDSEVAGDEAIEDNSADRPITGFENPLSDLFLSRLRRSDLRPKFFKGFAPFGEAARARLLPFQIRL
jgi:hypothetical protein